MTNLIDARTWRIYLFPPLCVLLIDLTSKYCAERTLDVAESVRVIGDIVRFTLVHNEGTTFGMFASSRAFLAISIVKLAFIVAVFFSCLHVPKFIHGSRYQLISRLSLTIVVGGSCGNLIDRFIDRRVTDFIDVGFHTFRWFVFNVADGFQVIGGLTVLSIVIWQYLGRRPKEPNQALLPTTTSVTAPAGQEPRQP